MDAAIRDAKVDDWPQVAGLLVELARHRGCFRMSLETARWRDSTHRFYVREGWTANGTWFVKLLDERWRATGFNE